MDGPYAARQLGLEDARRRCRWPLRAADAGELGDHGEVVAQRPLVERDVARHLGAAGEDVRFRTQLDQGLRDLDVAGGAPFAELDDAKKLEVLRGMRSTEFFEGVRSRVITSLYDDREVWSLLGYEGPSYDQGGYASRGFDDLDWLPAARIEQGS